MGAKKRFRKHVTEIMQEVQLAGQQLGDIEFDDDCARIRIVPTAEYPDAKPFTMLINMKAAPTKYDVLREMLETGFTHHRYDRADYAKAWGYR